MVKLILIFIISVLLGGKTTEAITLDGFAMSNIFSIKGGVITMEDVLLHVALDNPNDKIEKVIIMSHNGSLFEEGGCDDPDCTYNLSSLEKGFYDVIVSLKNGSQFSKTIYLN